MHQAADPGSAYRGSAGLKAVYLAIMNIEKMEYAHRAVDLYCIRLPRSLKIDAAFNTHCYHAYAKYFTVSAIFK